MAKYYLGIDGGGTKTMAVISDESGRILGKGHGGPSSIDTVSLENSFRSITCAVREAVGDKASLIFDSVFLGLGGIVTAADAKLVSEYAKKHLPYLSVKTVIEAKNDVYNALSAGRPLTSDGIVIIVGTGSVAFGVCDGEVHRAGGYGYHEGDPGSSYDLGRKVIALCGKWLDGRVDQSSLAEYVCKAYGIEDGSSFVQWSERLYGNRTDTAALAKHVTEHARLGGDYAIQIIDDATDELTTMVEAVYRALGMDSLNVAVAGGLGNDTTVFQILSEKIKSINANSYVAPCVLEPVMGSVIRALSMGGVSLNERIIDKMKEAL